MIYLDTSVVLSRLFAETQAPPVRFWSQLFTSSRLLEYEAFNQVLTRRGGNRLMPQTSNLLAQVDLLDLTPVILTRALQPFPIPVRTLDGLHLATMDFLRGHGQTIELATYDRRLAEGAVALGFPLTKL